MEEESKMRKFWKRRGGEITIAAGIVGLITAVSVAIIYLKRRNRDTSDVLKEAKSIAEEGSDNIPTLAEMGDRLATRGGADMDAAVALVAQTAPQEIARQAEALAGVVSSTKSSRERRVTPRV